VDAVSANEHVESLWLTAITPDWYSNPIFPALKQARIRNVRSSDHFGAWLHHVIMSEVGGDNLTIATRFSSPKEWISLNRLDFADEYATTVSGPCDLDVAASEGLGSCGATAVSSYRFFSHTSDYETFKALVQEHTPSTK
jgi:hypothetical protein